MDIFAQKKLLYVIIVLLVVLNVASLGMLWYQHAQRDVVPAALTRGGRGAMGRLVERELDLSGEQREKFDLLGAEHALTLTQTQDALIQAKRAILKEVTAPAPDTARVRLLVHEITANQDRLEWLLFDHFVQIRSLLREDQKQKFDNLIIEVTEAPPPQRRGGLRRGLPEGPPPSGRPEPEPRN